MYKPAIPDNVTNWKVFDDDHQILNFLSAQNTFEGMDIDKADHEKSLSDPSNNIPKSIISLEKFYDLQDKFRQTTNCKTQAQPWITPLSTWEQSTNLDLSILEYIVHVTKE